ncbi:MAG: hypothetical protein AAFN07_01605 [Pseudomonadota bacterium]
MSNSSAGIDVRPLTIITGIVMGSSVAISLGLLVAVIVYLAVGLDEPRVQEEFPALTGSIGMFLILTATSAASFAALIKTHRLRWVCQVAMWGSVLWIGYRYWPAS